MTTKEKDTISKNGEKNQEKPQSPEVSPESKQAQVSEEVSAEEEAKKMLDPMSKPELEAKQKKKTGGAKASTPKAKVKKKKIRRQVQRGCAFIRSSYNNTVVSLTDLHGNLLAWSSSGLLGFKGAKKATTYAATQVVLDVDEKVQKYGLREVDVYIKGVGGGREAALRALAQRGYGINRIKDITPMPHNGCRPKKPRRV